MNIPVREIGPSEEEVEVIMGWKLVKDQIVDEKGRTLLGVFERGIMYWTELEDPEAVEVARLAVKAPEMRQALVNLVRVFTEGRNYQSLNPYTRPEVRKALKVLAEINLSDWMDALPKERGKE